MESRATEKFWNAFHRLPKEIQKKANISFETFQKDPQHKSLRFKKIHTEKEIYSVRIGSGYRAIGIKEGNVLIWFWIGSHAAYDKLIGRM
jgi:hypothetical protein